MVKQKALGTEGFLLAILLAGGLSALNYYTGNPQQLAGDMGLCLPSTNLWTIPRLWSWILNLALIIGSGITLHLFNKSYSIVQTTDTVLPSAFMVLCAANPWLSGLLCTSIIMVVANIIALIVMFDCYRARNATQQVFVVFMMISLGTMFQYAFLFLIPAYIIIAMMMKCFRFKEFVAMLMGLAAPYWMAIGTGIVTIDSFTMPTMTNLFDGFTTTRNLFICMINIGLTSLGAVLISLNNAVKLYAGNSQRRLYNNAIIVLGLTSIVAIVANFNNLTAYIATLYLYASVQLANLYALWNVKKGSTWILFLAMIYVSGFVLMVYHLF